MYAEQFFYVRHAFVFAVGVYIALFGERLIMLHKDESAHNAQQTPRLTWASHCDIGVIEAPLWDVMSHEW